jgi:hypothetical protein
MTLQEKLIAYKKEFQKNAPPEAQALMHRATEELIASGILDKVTKSGDPAPDFALDDHNGNPVRSADLLANGPLVVSFYRGVW